MGQDILMMLRQDHEQFKHLLDQLKDSSSDETDKREEKFSELLSGIDKHMKAEEQMFYPKLKSERSSSEEDVSEGLEEHHMARQALKELEGMDKGEERWKPLLSVAKEMIEHHIAEEQAVLFEHADKGFSDAELEKMGEEFSKIRGPMSTSG
ncbi:MAG: hemerythrin domain-containing protein [candidate division WS1 bacterium]|jgi:hemerythrin-like domain-containing protein|nr:hemerythrin domain-containing protein [candidate division WS1 bacterium]